MRLLTASSSTWEMSRWPSCPQNSFDPDVVVDVIMLILHKIEWTQLEAINTQTLAIEDAFQWEINKLMFKNGNQGRWKMTEKVNISINIDRSWFQFLNISLETGKNPLGSEFALSSIHLQQHLELRLRMCVKFNQSIMTSLLNSYWESTDRHARLRVRVSGQSLLFSKSNHYRYMSLNLEIWNSGWESFEAVCAFQEITKFRNQARSTNYLRPFTNLLRSDWGCESVLNLFCQLSLQIIKLDFALIPRNSPAVTNSCLAVFVVPCF